MAHNTRTRSVWAPPETELLTGEAADLDQKTYTAVNGDDGGFWAPSSAIQVDGAGFTCTGIFRAGDTGSTEALSVSADIVFMSPGSITRCQGASEIEASTCTFKGTEWPQLDPKTFDWYPRFMAASDDLLYTGTTGLYSHRYAESVSPGAIANLAVPHWVPTITQYFAAFTYYQTGVAYQQAMLSATSTQPRLLFDFGSLPYGTKINKAGVYVIGSRDSTALPATKPTINLYKYSTAVEWSTIGSDVVDPSTNLTDYKALHDLKMTGLTEVVGQLGTGTGRVNRYNYGIVVSGDLGAGAAAGTIVFRPYLNITVSSLEGW